MECPSCGAENHRNAQFCDACSASFIAAPAALETTAAEAVSEGAAIPSGWVGRDAVPLDEDGDPSLGDSQDYFHQARLDESRWYVKRRERIEAAGGPEAYELMLRSEMETARRARRKREAVVRSVVLAVAAAVAVALTWLSVGWAGSAMTRASADPGGSLGAAFGLAVGLLVVASVLGATASRLGRKTVWGFLAAAVLLASQCVVMVPLIDVQAGPAALGVAAFIFTSFVGGFAGAAYGGSGLLD